MTWLALIPCFVLAALPPLTGPQKEMLTATPSLTNSFDQAGLYALLANAATWSDDPAANEAGTRLPDYAAISEHTDEWLGEACLIEGTLVSRVQLGTLSRIGYDNVQSWTIRTPKSAPGGGNIVIVFLTDPPEVDWKKTIGHNTLPAKEGLQVRIVGRFYTIFQTPDTTQNLLNYPIFVGKTAVFPNDSPAGEPGYRTLLLATVIFVMFVAYIIVIIIRIKRSRASRSRQVADTPTRRIRRKVDARDDLPEDPAAAMNALEQEHNQQD